MPPRKPRTPGSPLAPNTPSTAPTSSGRGSDLATALPATLEFSLPNFSGLVPQNWFRPSSSSVEQVSDEDFEAESKIAHEQGNALELMGLNLDNVEQLAKNAVKATKIGKLMGEYLVGIEAMRTVGVTLRNAKSTTANEERKGLIITEKGRQIDLKLVGEQTKTAIEQQKIDLLNDESSYYRDLRPIDQTRWQNMLESARAKAQQALGGRRTA